VETRNLRRAIGEDAISEGTDDADSQDALKARRDCLPGERTGE
jgi:hypothetical protein